MRKMEITLYTMIQDGNCLAEFMRERFKEVTKMYTPGEDHWILVLQDDSMIRCSMVSSEREPGAVAEHVREMTDYFSSLETKLKDTKQDVLYRMSRVDCVVFVEFELDEQQDRRYYILQSLIDVTKRMACLVLYPDMTLCDGRGKLLFLGSGKNEYRQILQDRGDESLWDNNMVEEQGPGDKSCDRPFCETSEEIARRALALFAVALYSEVLLSEKPDREEALSYVHDISEKYALVDEFSPLEKAYLDNPAPDQDLCVKFLWEYESCVVLFWVLGVVEMEYPSVCHDVPVIAEFVMGCAGIEDVTGLGKMKGYREVIMQGERNIHYMLLCMDAWKQGEKEPESLKVAVVVKRQDAFAWLFGREKKIGWDDSSWGAKQE